MEEETGEDTIQAAHKTRQHQGCHEAEVTFGGEADLHKHYRGCKKNPGHTQFIPIQDFKIEHLPPDYRDKLVLDGIKAEADLTCRLSVRYTSESRPKFHPEHPHLFYPFYEDRGYDWMRVGTGSVWHVSIYNEKHWEGCKCKECRQPGTLTPKKEWGLIHIHTASHVMFNFDEARHTTCHFFYDAGSTHINQCPSITGYGVWASDILADASVMICATHDMDLVKKLYAISEHRRSLRHQVCEKYKPNMNNVWCDSDPEPRLTVIISHPHGLSKQVTVGEWTHRQISSSPPLIFDDEDDEFVDIRYRYNTATCPGSSGAPIIILPKFIMWWLFRVLHSEGGDGNNNKSSTVRELQPMRYLSPL